MFEDDKNEKTNHNYWKLFTTIVAALLAADLISGTITAAIVAHQMKAAATVLSNTATSFTDSLKKRTEQPTMPIISFKEQQQRKAQAILDECRFWIDLYNSQPSKENAENRSKACKPVGIY